MESLGEGHVAGVGGKGVGEEGEERAVRVPWTLPLLAVALAVISACLLIPQAQSNRKAAHELAMLKADHQNLLEQSELNRLFLERMGTDVDLSQRLAQRQLRLVPKGTEELVLPGVDQAGAESVKTGSVGYGGGHVASPYGLVKLPGPVAVAEPEPVVWPWLDKLMANPRQRLYLIGAAMLVCAIALLIDGSGKRTNKQEEFVVRGS